MSRHLPEAHSSSGRWAGVMTSGLSIFGMSKVFDRISLCGRGRPVHRRVFSITPGLYSPDASGNPPPLYDGRNVLRDCLPTAPRLKTTDYILFYRCGNRLGKVNAVPCRTGYQMSVSNLQPFPPTPTSSNWVLGFATYVFHVGSSGPFSMHLFTKSG